jgi:hypothetical protein
MTLASKPKPKLCLINSITLPRPKSTRQAPERSHWPAVCNLSRKRKSQTRDSPQVTSSLKRANSNANSNLILVFLTHPTLTRSVNQGCKVFLFSEPEVCRSKRNLELYSTQVLNMPNFEPDANVSRSELSPYQGHKRLSLLSKESEIY